MPGDKNLGRWFETRPAVIDASPNSETPGASLWVGSRHLVVYAIKRGLFECCAIGKHLTSYRLTREGRSLWRDMADMAQHLQARVRDLTAELAEVYATVDIGIEMDVDPLARALETGGVDGTMSIQGAAMVTLRDAEGGWVSGDILNAKADAARGQIVQRKALTDAVYRLRKRGWLDQPWQCPSRPRTLWLLLFLPDFVGEAICNEENDRGDYAGHQAERPIGCRDR